MKKQEFINWVNETFRPENKKYPVGLVVDGEFIISAESAVHYPESTNEDEILLPIADFYAEFRGGDPWIHPELEAKAEAMGLFLEWKNAGCLGVYDG